AMSADIKALLEPIALRLIQGTSTKPAIGSHTKPNKLLIAIAIALALCLGVPPATSTAAAAPIPEALPTSAWQPPVAPAMQALLAITIPNPPAVNKNLTICSSSNPNLFSRVPEDPAVGVAHITPIAALTSFVAMADCTA